MSQKYTISCNISANLLTYSYSVKVTSEQYIVIQCISLLTVNERRSHAIQGYEKQEQFFVLVYSITLPVVVLNEKIMHG